MNNVSYIKLEIIIENIVNKEELEKVFLIIIWICRNVYDSVDNC